MGHGVVAIVRAADVRRPGRVRRPVQGATSRCPSAPVRVVPMRRPVNTRWSVVRRSATLDRPRRRVDRRSPCRADHGPASRRANPRANRRASRRVNLWVNLRVTRHVNAVVVAVAAERAEEAVAVMVPVSHGRRMRASSNVVVDKSATADPSGATRCASRCVPTSPRWP